MWTHFLEHFDGSKAQQISIFRVKPQPSLSGLMTEDWKLQFEDLQKKKNGTEANIQWQNNGDVSLLVDDIQLSSIAFSVIELTANSWDRTSNIQESFFFGSIIFVTPWESKDVYIVLEITISVCYFLYMFVQGY